MLTRIDRETIAAILGPDWESVASTSDAVPNADEKSERNVDTPERKPEQ